MIPNRTYLQMALIFIQPTISRAMFDLNGTRCFLTFYPEQGFSSFLVQRPFNTASLTVVTPNDTRILLLLHSCNESGCKRLRSSKVLDEPCERIIDPQSCHERTTNVEPSFRLCSWVNVDLLTQSPNPIIK